MDKLNFTGAVFIDLYKAFDSVRPSCLLSKLPCYGISGIDQQWIADYLFNRQQFVSLGDTPSDLQHLCSWVPQGSTLGPLLYMFLINDAYLSLEKCTILMYADKTVLLFSSKESKGIENTLMPESELLLTWFKKNSLVPKFQTWKNRSCSQRPCQNAALSIVLQMFLFSVFTQIMQTRIS